MQGVNTMKISYGSSRYESYLKTVEISWEDFCKRLEKPVRTYETFDEFLNMSSDAQNNIKDVGGFVGGVFLNGRRSKNALISRSLITLDLDNGKQGIEDIIFDILKFKCCVYSTHKYTKQKPRLRIVIPLTREVTSEEYKAISYKIATIIGIDFFDKASYEAERFMYWPSVSADGEYFFREQPGEMLSPKDFDLSDKGYMQYDRKLVVDLFCQIYSINSAIEKFLNGVYIRESSDRYRYSKSNSPAGAIVVEDRYLYSFHASDPANGKMRDSFDLVRIHLFSHMDDCVGQESLSFNAMLDFALRDKQVALLLKDSGKCLDDKMTCDNNGKIKDTLSNIVTVLKNDTKLQGIVFDLHSGRISVKGNLPWKQVKPGWNDADYASLKVYLNQHYGFHPSNKIRDAVLAVSADRSFHPVLDYINSLPTWDGITRIERLLIDYLGAEDCDYVREVTKKTIVAAVSRVKKPGIKFDSVLILNGPQGIGKSTLFSKLGGEWFSDSLTISDMKDKSAAEKLQGYWILELGELSGMKKTDVEVVKGFISRNDDKYRASYGTVVESHQRQSIIVGTTNSEMGFLRDITGNRRFWPVYVNGISDRKPWQLSKEDVEQIWAEALVLYEKGTSLYIDETHILAQARVQQNQAMEHDDREGLVRAYLKTDIPYNWDEMKLHERREYLQDEKKQKDVCTQKRKRVCNIEIWAECFGHSPADMKKADSYEISSIMKKIFGWSNELSNKVYNFSIYGKQRAYFLEFEGGTK